MSYIEERIMLNQIMIMGVLKDTASESAKKMLNTAIDETIELMKDEDE